MPGIASTTVMRKSQGFTSPLLRQIIIARKTSKIVSRNGFKSPRRSMESFKAANANNRIKLTLFLW